MQFRRNSSQNGGYFLMDSLSFLKCITRIRLHPGSCMTAQQSTRVHYQECSVGALTSTAHNTIDARILPSFKMTPKKMAPSNAVSDIHASPLEQITELELEQERRVLRTAEQFQSEKSEIEKEVMEAEKSSEEQFRSQAATELEAFARTEPVSLLKQAEKETSAAMAALSKHADKHFPATLNATLSQLLDGTLYTKAA